MRQKRVTDPLQRCAYCLQCPDPHKYPTHSLGKFKPAGTKDPKSRNISKKDIGCPRYEESAEHLKEKKETFLANRRKTSRHYFVPPPSWAPRGAQTRVCRSTFIHIFGLSKHAVILDTLSQRNQSVPMVLQQQDSTTKKRKAGRKAIYNLEIKDHLKTFKRVTSHYSNTAQQSKAKFFFDPTLNPSKLWMMWCDIYDTAYAAQARDKGYWTSYDGGISRKGKVYGRAPPKLPDGEEWIKPRLAHSTYAYKIVDMGEGEPWCSLLCLVTLLLPFIVS